MVLELIYFYPIKYQKKAALTAAAVDTHTGFSADDVGESSLKHSAAMTIKMFTLDLQATLPRFSTNLTFRAKPLALTSAHYKFQRDMGEILSDPYVMNADKI